MKLAVLVIIDTDDPLLDPDRLDVSTVAKTAALRASVIRALPKLERVIMVTPEPMARVMMAAHQHSMEAIGQGHTIRRSPNARNRMQ